MVALVPVKVLVQPLVLPHVLGVADLLEAAAVEVLQDVGDVPPGAADALDAPHAPDAQVALPLVRADVVVVVVV